MTGNPKRFAYEAAPTCKREAYRPMSWGCTAWSKRRRGGLNHFILGLEKRVLGGFLGKKKDQVENRMATPADLGLLGWWGWGGREEWALFIYDRGSYDMWLQGKEVTKRYGKAAGGLCPLPYCPSREGGGGVGESQTSYVSLGRLKGGGAESFWGANPWRIWELRTTTPAKLVRGGGKKP